MQFYYPHAQAEQGNVIGSVRIYIYKFINLCVYKKIVIERTRDLIVGTNSLARTVNIIIVVNLHTYYLLLVSHDSCFDWLVDPYTRFEV